MFNTLSTSTLALVVALSVAASAAKRPDQDTLKGTLKESKILKANTIYILSGYVAVDSGYTLAIEPGTTVKGQKSTKGTLAIKRGARILAEGTRNKPITFTSDEPDSQKTRGSWGGLVILGRAKTNKGTDKFEAVEEWPYGGDNDDDSSGVLTYVRVENPGFPVAPDKELNGVTLCAVGRKTKISHVQVHNGDDDGFEFFGGTVSPDHLVVTNQVDDGFDSDNGFSGTVSWIINVQGSDADRVRSYIVKTPDGRDSVVNLPNEVVGDKCFESSSTKLATAPFHTHPTWTHVTAIDNGKSGGGINLNEQAVGTFDHMILIGDSSSYAVNLQSAQTNAGLLANPATLKFTKSYLGGTFKTAFVTNDSANAALIKTGLSNVLKVVATPLYKDLGPKNDTLVDDSVGAVLGSDPKDFWYQGWTLPGTVTYAKGESRNPGAVRPGRVHGPSRLFNLGLSGSGLVVNSAIAALASVEVTDAHGKRLFLRENVKLATGENRLGSPWGKLSAGTYFLTVRSGQYAEHYSLPLSSR